MTDDRFEHELRGFLTAREPAAVSPVLRARLQAITAEPPARTGVLGGRLGGAWRAVAWAAGAVAVAVVLIAVLVRLDSAVSRDPGPVGGPSAVPAIPSTPHVTAPVGEFTPGAMADAERQLAAVFAATGVEARFLVVPQTTGTQLSAPDGWPDRFDSDGSPDRDVLAVIGMAPDGTPVCCLTLAGTLIERAKANYYWRVTDQPGALDMDLAAPIAEERDIALDRFVRGIEDLAPAVEIMEAETWSNDDIQRSAGLLAVLVPLLLLAFFALRRRSESAVGAGGSVDGIELLEVTSVTATAPVPIGPAGTSPVTPSLETVSGVPPSQGGAGLTRRASRWRAVPAWAVRSDRFWVLLSFAAMAGLALLGVVDLLLPAETDVRLDPTIDGVGVGVARAGLSILPVVLIGIVLAALIAYARQGRWHRRIGVVALAALVGWTMSIVVDQTVPTMPATDRGWVTGDGGVVTWNMGGLAEQVTYRIAPGEAFTFATTIRNPGALPLTILGLDGVATTVANPYVASVVSIGWVVQPTADGPVTYLSARPEDASASWPVTLAPGENLAIVIVGRGGQCAEPDGTGSILPVGQIDVAYRVLGFERSAEVGLPAMLSVPARPSCTVEFPGGSITYGP